MDCVKLAVRFKKTGMMRFISHLDFVRLTYRALRRAGIPYVLTNGFNPHPKVKFAQALKLGLEGEIETLFFLKYKVDLEDFKTKITQQLNKDLEVVDINYAE